VLLTVSHNQRFVPSHVLAQEILDSGCLGKPYLVHAVFGHRGPEAWSPTQQWYFRPDLAGLGVIADLGSHKIDLMRWLLGQDVTEVAAFASTFEKATTLDDTMVCTLRFSGGTLATLQVSWVFRPDWENSLVLRCERGVIRVPTEASDPVRVLEMNKSGLTVESTHLCKDSDPAGWLGMVAAFVRAVTQHQPAPVSGEDGRATLAAVLAAHESASAQKVVHVAI
jgi:predicted dehydrogenase